MNIPGLDSSWITGHKLMVRMGAIKPWNLDQCRASLIQNAGVLVVANTALGDTILCTPLLKTLSDALTQWRVGFLVRTAYKELYRPGVGEVFAVDGKFRGLNELKKNMSSSPVPFRIALVANCTEPDIIPWLWHCGIRGFLRYKTRWSVWADWFANKDMMREPSAPDYATGHAIENNLAMAEALGIKPTTHQLHIAVNSAPRPASKLVLIHPGASRQHKRWPASNWKEVIEKLQSKKFTVALTGDSQERALGDHLNKLLSVPVENWSGKLSLVQLAAKQGEALLFLSGDTGPYHLAIAVGCPTVTLFAPTDRGSSTEACGPYQVDSQKHIALETKIYGDSISTITPQQVLAHAERILGKSKP